MRSVVFWLHLTCGLGVGLVVLDMSVTGVLLTYQSQITEWADRGYWTAPGAPDADPVALSALVASAGAYTPELQVSAVTLRSDPEAPASVSLRGGGGTLYLDPSTAEVRGEGSTSVRAFFRHVVGWHRWFDLGGEGRTTARAVTGWSNVAFLFLVVSGLYLWIPRRWRWQHFRSVLLFNPGARGRARDFNWHHVFGAWLAVPLLVVVASATVISFPWASDLAYRAVGEAPPPRRARAERAPPRSEDEGSPPPFDMSALDRVQLAATNRLDGWRTLTFSVPDRARADIQVRIERGRSGEPQKRHTLTYSAASGAEIGHSSFEDQSPGRRFRTFLRFAHTGEYFGVVGQTLAGLASLAGIVLVWTGFALAWRRLVVPLVRRARAD